MMVEQIIYVTAQFMCGGPIVLVQLKSPAKSSAILKCIRTTFTHLSNDSTGHYTLLAEY